MIVEIILLKNTVSILGNFRMRSECLFHDVDVGLSYSQSNVMIYDCFFVRSVQNSGNGGVIFVSGGSYFMNVSRSMFYNCSCSSSGGAIYFDSSNACLKTICANRCSASSKHFAYVETTQNNMAEFITFSDCSYSAVGQYGMWFHNGYQAISNLNSSMNNVQRGSGVIFSYPLSFHSSFCTVSHNYASQDICVEFYHCSGKLSFSNIVENNSPSSYGVNIINVGSSQMLYCIFRMNHNALFCVLSGSLSVSHCFIFHDETFSSLNPIAEYNNSLTMMQTYKLQYYYTHFCYAELPINQPNSINKLQYAYNTRINIRFFGVLLLITSAFPE